VLWTLTQFPRTDFGPPDIEQSALGQIGHFIEPAMEPLGFDWRIGVGIVTSLAAREVIIGTLGTIFGVETADEEAVELQAILKRDLEPAAAVGLVVFFAFPLQCMSTVAMVRRETAGWKWPFLQFSYMLFLGYTGAFIAYRIF
jgi:ferrous iron transport protein B